MTIEEYKDWYYELHEKYEETSFAMLQRGLKTILKKLKKANPGNFKEDVEQLITYEDIFDVILSIYLVIGRAQADRMLKGIEANTINIKANNPLFGEAFAKQVLWYLENFGGAKIVSMRDEFIGGVIDYILEKNKAGDSFVKTVTELEENFGEETGLYRWQMQRIVRTETMSASNFASWEAMKSERLIIDKVWIATNDPRTRDGESKKEYDHLAMEGITLPRETKFKVPNQDGSIDELMYPVDPNGAPGNTINCRCTIAPRPRRDKDGKLIFRGKNEGDGIIPGQEPFNKPAPKPKPKPKKAPGKILTVSDAEARIRALGVQNVDLKKLTKEEWQMVLKTMESEAKYKEINLKTLKVISDRRKKAYGSYASWKGEVMLNIGNIRKHEKEILEPFKKQIDRFEKRLIYLNSLDLSKYNAKQVRTRIKAYNVAISKAKNNISKGILKPKHWSMSEATDNHIEHLRTTFIHELGHYRHHKQTDAWGRYKRFNKDLSITEYGMTNWHEYFTEWYTYYRLKGTTKNIPKDVMDLIKQIEK